MSRPLRLLAADRRLSQRRGRDPPAHGWRAACGHVRQDGQQPGGAHCAGDCAVQPPSARCGAATCTWARSTAIERGVLDGQYQIGIIPGHRSSDALEYAELFDETMLLYCGTAHPLFGAEPRHSRRIGKVCAAYQFAGLGYHSPNMELSQQVRLTRKATGFDQEAIATLILSGQFLGFLPDHYAQSFVRAGLMRAVQCGGVSLHLPVFCDCPALTRGGAGHAGVPGMPPTSTRRRQQRRQFPAGPPQGISPLQRPAWRSAPNFSPGVPGELAPLGLRTAAHGLPAQRRDGSKSRCLWHRHVQRPASSFSRPFWNACRGSSCCGWKHRAPG
jgi:hypothetical protein